MTELGYFERKLKPRHGILYVASTGDNAVYAVRDALKRRGSRGTGTVIYADQAHLHGALAMVFGPNGDLLVSTRPAD